MTAAHVDALAANIRAADADELRAAGLSVHEALAGADGLAMSDGPLLGVYGCQPHPGHARAGIPWLLCTEAVSSGNRRQIASACVRHVSIWRAEFDHLENMVHASNAQAVRLIRWLGFTVHPEPVGPGGAFLFFTWSASDV